MKNEGAPTPFSRDLPRSKGLQKQVEYIAGTRGNLKGRKRVLKTASQIDYDSFAVLAW